MSRPGSEESQALFTLALSDSAMQQWTYYLQHYEEALQEVANSKKRPDLLALDHFLHQDLVASIDSRTPKHMTHKELADVMKWKLCRGQMRPLQKVVESNSSSSVVSSSTKAFQHLDQKHWQKAFESLCELRGIGTATASAVLAALDEDNCPFMADEVIDSVFSGKRDYTMKVYEDVRRALMKKSQELNQLTGNDDSIKWTAEKVGKALWTCAKLKLHKNITISSIQISGSTKKNNSKRSLDSNGSDLEQASESNNKRRKK